jgi:hypothetical protein
MTLAGEGFIVQSADHRLTELPSHRVVDDAERKQLLVLLERGAAAISFAGIGIADGKRAAEVLYEAVVQAGNPLAAAFDDIYMRADEPLGS